MQSSFHKKLLGGAVLLLLSCAAASAARSRERISPTPRDLPPAPSDRAIPFVTIEARAHGRPNGELRRVLSSSEAYLALLGSAPPADLDFQREWVVVYAAGTFSTGGYRAEIASIARSFTGDTITIGTRLVAPGPHCFVTQAFTNPYVVARFRRPAEGARIVWSHDVSVHDCEGGI